MFDLYKFAGHGPMIEDPKHGTYYRVVDVNPKLKELAELREEVAFLRNALERYEPPGQK